MDWKEVGQDMLFGASRVGTQILDASARLALNTLYPKEFEVYMVTLELVTHDDESKAYFTFPINPSSITKTQPYLKQIDRNYGAVIVNKSGKFVPQTLSIKGTFGRQFRYISREQSLDISTIQWLPDKNEFSSTYKSGYGCFKIVQDICDEADKLDDGFARKLFFHNLAMGESYLVEVLDFTGSQDQSSNMIWNYELRLNILTEITSQNKLREWGIRQIGTSVTKAVNAVVTNGKTVLGKLLKG